MKISKIYLYAATFGLMALSFVACQNQEGWDAPIEEKVPISLRGDINQLAVTRASDNGFAAGDVNDGRLRHAGAFPVQAQVADRHVLGIAHVERNRLAANLLQRALGVIDEIRLADDRVDHPMRRTLVMVGNVEAKAFFCLGRKRTNGRRHLCDE